MTKLYFHTHIERERNNTFESSYRIPRLGSPEFYYSGLTCSKFKAIWNLLTARVFVKISSGFFSVEIFTTSMSPLAMISGSDTWHQCALSVYGAHFSWRVLLHFENHRKSPHFSDHSQTPWINLYAILLPSQLQSMTYTQILLWTRRHNLLQSWLPAYGISSKSEHQTSYWSFSIRIRSKISITVTSDLELRTFLEQKLCGQSAFDVSHDPLNSIPVLFDRIAHIATDNTHWIS